MMSRSFRLVGRLPGARWLPLQVARIRGSIHTKLLVAFISIVMLLVALGAVGLGALQSANERAAELVRLENRIAAYRQLQHNATGQLYATASAFLATDAREIDVALHQLQRFSYDFDRAEHVAEADTELLREVAEDYAELMRIGTEIIGLVRAGRRDEARAMHHDRSVPLAGELERRALSLVNKAESDMVDRAAQSEGAYRTSQTALLAASLATILLALVLGYSTSNSLIEPVRLNNASTLRGPSENWASESRAESNAKAAATSTREPVYP
jgi:CHASE3 domain sensor protein